MRTLKVHPAVVLLAVCATSAVAELPDKVYWSLAGIPIYRANLDGTNVEYVLENQNVWVHELDIDPIGEKLYWLYAAGGPVGVLRANLDGSNTELLVYSPFCRGLDVEVYEAKIYWTGGDILRANLDGTNIEVLVSSQDEPWDIALGCGKVYWSHLFSGEIRRANRDGSDVEVIATDLGIAVSLAIDNENGHLYMVAEHEGIIGIHRSDLNGWNIELILEGYGSLDLALDVRRGKMYWSQANLDAVLRANLDGTDVEVVVSMLDPRWTALTKETPPCGNCMLGDMNGDWVVDYDDVAGFVAALMYPEQASRATFCVADFDRDFSIDGNDIGRFLSRVLQDLSPPQPSPMVWETPPTAISTSALAMAAAEAWDATPPVEYFFLYWPGDGAGGNTRIYDASHTYADDGLDANTVYTYSVRARDSANPRNYSVESPPGSGATHIETPTGFVAGTITPSSIEVTATSVAGGFSNLTAPSSGLLFKCWETVGGDPNKPLAESGWVTSPTWSATGLQSATEYTIAVRARNQDAVETTWHEANFTTQ